MVGIYVKHFTYNETLSEEIRNRKRVETSVKCADVGRATRIKV